MLTVCIETEGKRKMVISGSSKDNLLEEFNNRIKKEDEYSKYFLTRHLRNISKGGMLTKSTVFNNGKKSVMTVTDTRKPWLI